MFLTSLFSYPKTLKWVVVYSSVTFHINAHHNDTVMATGLTDRYIKLLNLVCLRLGTTINFTIFYHVT